MASNILTTTEEMIEEYTGDVVINSYEALSNVIEEARRADAKMYGAFRTAVQVLQTAMGAREPRIGLA